VQRTRRLQAEQAAADHDPATRPIAPERVHPRLERLHVLDRPVDEGARQVGAGDRRHERRRPGGEHQGVVRLGAAVDGEGPRRDIDRGDRLPDVDRDQRVLRETAVVEQQVDRRAAREVRREADPVVRRPRLLAVEVDRPGRVDVAVAQRLDEAVGDHPAPDDAEASRSRRGQWVRTGHVRHLRNSMGQ
jgi:hypothetical protein